MSAIGTASSGGHRLRSGRSWLRRRIRVGPEGSGHLVGILALVCIAAYGALVAISPLQLVSLYPTAVLRDFGFIGWWLWIGTYLWCIVQVLRGRRHAMSTQLVAVAGLVWSMVLFVVM